MGGKPKLTPHQVRESLARRDKGEEPLSEIARNRARDESSGREPQEAGWSILSEPSKMIRVVGLCVGCV